MQSNNPGLNQKEYDRRMDMLKKCGENRGPHDYIPVSWTKTISSEHIPQMMCRVCFTRVSINTLIENFPEAKLT